MITDLPKTRGVARLGIVVPVSNTNLEPDMHLLAPAGVSVHFARAGGYDVDEIPDATQMRNFSDSGIDDIVDSGGTLCNAAEALLENGAKSVAAYITHGVLSGGAVARIDGSQLKELVITDSIRPTEAAEQSQRIRILPIAPLVGEAIRRIADESSVSSLFD